jgi:glycosyltransferase involved in cell wall biosynthesis
VLVVPRGLYNVPREPIQGIFESHQVLALRAAGVQVGVLSGGVITTRHLGRRFPYSRRELVDDVPVYRAYRRALLPARWEDPVRAADRTFRGLKPLLTQYIADQGRPDVVHAHNLATGGLVARRIHADMGIPYVVTEHTGTYVADPSAAARDAAVLAEAAAEARAVVAVGSGLASSLRDSLAGRSSAMIEVVPNVVESRLLSCQLRTHQGVFTVVGLGNLIPSKNYPLLVQAFSRADLPEGSRLVVGGDGPEARRVADLARTLGVGDRLHLAGHLDRDHVVRLLQTGDLFAHPSNSESFGVVLIEAMAVGLPVLATASYGPRDIVTPEVGRLTPIGDAQAFADGLSEMYARRDEFDPERLRATCRERFGSEAFASRMLEIYHEATA